MTFFFSFQGTYRDSIIEYYTKIMNTTQTPRKKTVFDEEYAKLTILLDSLDVDVVEESFIYGEGQETQSKSSTFPI